jgi:Integrase zinc binding domain/Integrase core domain
MGDQVIKRLKELPVPNKAKADKADWEFRDGLAFREGLVVVADKEIKRKILEMVHDSTIGGHPGQQKTRELISRDSFWYKMTEDVNQFVNGCRKCQQTKIFPAKPQGELYPNLIPDKPFQVISVDFLTDLPSSQGYDSIMIVVDRSSKRVYSVPCNKTITSEGAARLFKDTVWRYKGLPETVISDRGPQFTLEFTRELYKLLGIKQNLSTAAHAQTDGQTERVNQEIEQYFRVFINNQMNDWVSWLPIAEHCYNNRVHSATGVSPFFATRGYEVNTSFSPTKQRSNPEKFDEFAERMSKAREEAKCALKRAADDMKRFYDRKRKPEEYKVGEQVWLDAKNVTTDRPKKKLDHKRLGPFKITQKISSVVYKLELPSSWRIHPVFHVSKLRRYIPDPYNRPLPRVTLHVRGDNWEIHNIKSSKLQNGRLEYHVTWKLPEGTFQDLWELESRILNEAPEKIKQFHRDHPSAPRRLSNLDFASLKFTEPVDHSLPSELELQNLSYKTNKWVNCTAAIPTQISP